VARLLERLPTGRKRYSYGTYVVDGNVFELCVGAGSTRRCYTVADVLGDDATSDEARRVVDAIRYFRSLVPSSKAAWPPAVGGSEEPQNKGMKLSKPEYLGGLWPARSGIIESGFAAYAQC
jgi:hypothetical protein